MREESDALKSNVTLMECDCPSGRKSIGVMGGCRAKSSEAREIIRGKRRLVAFGYQEEEGIDFSESFLLP